MDRGAVAVLEAELRARLVDVSRIADRIEARQEAFDERAEEVDSLGYQLHNLYGAFEQVFEEVARCFENRVDAAGYHAGLIRRMQLDIPGVRPALLAESTAADLDELRRFRHRFRHAYSADLDPHRVVRLAAMTAPLRRAFARDIEQFLSRLRSE
jgi:hypothetical protein